MTDLQDFAASDRGLLIRIIKDCQKSKVQGANGSWKDFLKAQTPSLSRTDPALHSWQTLAGFLATLSRPQAGVLLVRHRDWEEHQQQRAALVARLSQTNAAETCQDSLWLIVQQSLTHARFPESYNFSSFQQGWIRISSAGLDTSSRPCLLSLDCEMCETASNTRELIGLSVVNEAGSTVLKMLVKPAEKVLDFRTEVTGATEATMQGVTYSKQDAQQAVQRLMKGNAVLVGHALHHDLHALQLDPIAVIDTSLIYSYRNLATCTPSLANLVSQLLKRNLRQEGDPHDCEQDAAAAMQLVKHAILHGVPSAMEAPQVKVSKDELKKLFVHGIPATAQPADLLHLFDSCTCACPAVQADLKERRAYLVFKHAGEANEAFKQLPGAQDADSFGRAQKQLRLTSGVSQGKLVKIRKTAAHGGLAFGKDSSQKVHVLKQEAKRKQTSQNKQHKRKKAKTQEL